MAASSPHITPRRHPDAPEYGELDRYAIYVVNPKVPRVIAGRWRDDTGRRRVYCTSRDGIGQGLEMLLDENEIPRGWRVGVLDRVSRRWIVNPFV